jgi:outer membrane lipoprotein-sorting protein
MRRRELLGGLAGLWVVRPLAAAVANDEPVRQWIGKARGLKSVTAEFRQERYLRALNRPLVTPGRLWYRADGALRWQLGEPPKTIALRRGPGAEVTVIEPAARTVRVFATDAAGVKSGAVALLDAGFPESYEAFDKRFRLDGLERDDAGAWRVETGLRDNSLSVAVQRMVFVVDPSTFHLRALEVWFRDGSRIVSHFTDLKENAPVPDAVFEEATDGFRRLK